MHPKRSMRIDRGYNHVNSIGVAMVVNKIALLNGDWNAIDSNCSVDKYLLTINDGIQVKTLRLIVK